MQSKSKTGPIPFPPGAPADQYEATFWQHWRAQLRLLGQKPWLATTWLKQSHLLLERFNRIYSHLCHQPRPVRRRLQRRLGATLTGAALALTLANLPVQAADFAVNDAGTLIAAINAANDETTNPGPDTITLTNDVLLTTGTYDGALFYNALPPISSTITIEGNGFTIARDLDAEDPFGLFAVLDPGDLTLNETTLTGAVAYVGGALFNYDGTVTVNQSTFTGNIGAIGGAILNLAPTATIEINDSTLTDNGGYKYGSAFTNGGTATLTNSTVENNKNKYLGGSIANLAMLTITDSTITNNSSDYGSGGGILNQEGTLTITSSAITNNTVTGTEEDGGLGGGIYNVDGEVTLTDSTISGNSSGFSGGGLFNFVSELPTARAGKPRQQSPESTVAAKLQQLGFDSARIKALQTALAAFKAQQAAKVQAQAVATATMTLVNSTVSDNTAGTNTETVRTNDDDGGGIVNAGGILNLTNSTVSGNQAPNNTSDFVAVGGGIFNVYGELTLKNSTVTGNQAGYGGGGLFNEGELTLERNLIAGNSAGEQGNELFNYVGCATAATTTTAACLASTAAVSADAFNLFGHSGENNTQAFYGFTPGASDITATSNGTTPTALASILNTTLADNGGATFTHALVNGSPALDAAGDSGLATDQRGITRPQGAADDIGAFELATTSASPLNLIYMSSHSNGTIDGVPYRDEDILLYNTVTKKWSLFFDGSDVGVGNADLDAFTILDDGTILMSFDKGLQFPTLGLVSDADIVKFTPTQLGVNTSGSFTLFFDGSDVELTTGGEDIDAISYTSDGKLLISVGGSARVGALRAQDEDLLRFTPTSLGATTAGTWELYFDGSAVGLTAGSEDIGAATVDSAGQLYLATKGKFKAASQNAVAGDGNDIFGCVLVATGENSTSCTFFTFFDGGLTQFKQLIDGLSLGSAAVTGLGLADTTDTVGTPVQFATVADAAVTDDTEYDEFDQLADEEVMEINSRIYLPLISD